MASPTQDAIEDFKRYQSDRSLNNQHTDVLVNGAFVPRMWKDIAVGDIVRIRDNEDVPADVLVLATSEPQGVCYVETKNLDGETNLKERRGLKRTEHCQSAEELAKLVLEVHAEAPSRDLYSFTAAVVVGEHRKQETVGADSLLLRGCRLRNCASAYGLVLYTGADTKIVLNGGGTPLKRTKLEKVMNRQVRRGEARRGSWNSYAARQTLRKRPAVVRAFRAGSVVDCGNHPHPAGGLHHLFDRVQRVAQGHERRQPALLGLDV